jgi:hypothetical protein
MATNVVNLDALIPREDFAVNAGPTAGTHLNKLDIHHLDDHFFAGALCKPDFQRETAYWTPEKVVDLIRAFIDGDLIPAVILWQAGKDVFVIDGSHRLSALIAWVKDDYGDQLRSREYFGGHIVLEQKKAADRTRKLVNEQIGSYSVYVAGRKNPGSVLAEWQPRLSRLATAAVDAQWVPAVDAEAAENSFFKINEAATPIDFTERRILKARHSPNAIAARAIVRAGSGNKYWHEFDDEKQREVEAIGKSLFKALYEPPIAEGPVKTLDLPVAGRGYSALPFVFDLVNIANGVKIPDSSRKRGDDALPKDDSGEQTLAFLEKTRKMVDRITGTQSTSVGVHPAIYFYSRSGSFQPAAFLATAKFLEDLAHTDKLREFASVRLKFEDFLQAHRDYMSLITHRLGSGGRSLAWIKRLFDFILREVLAGKSDGQIVEALGQDKDGLAFLESARPPLDEAGAKRTFGRGVKSEVFLRDAIASAVPCAICHAKMHKNSMQVDHRDRKREGGGAHAGNAEMVHPYCNSMKN